MAGSTVHVKNMPGEAPPMSPDMILNFGRFVDAHVEAGDVTARTLISGFVSDGRADLALMVVSIAAQPTLPRLAPKRAS